MKILAIGNKNRTKEIVRLMEQENLAIDIEDKVSVDHLILLAKKKYPISVTYKDRFIEDDMNMLDKICDVRCSSVYMNGTGTYSIRYRP